MTPNRSEKTLQNLQDNLLADIEAMRKNIQARVPSDIEDVSEAYERYARILTMLSKTLEVMSRLQTQKKKDAIPQGDPQNRQSLVADIEQKLARLAQAEAASPPSEGAE
ncbi:MAG: hypothetical protein HN715_03710 [Rhodobiaceae bacterium]|nr:hypothetical protein [Rhodobiaceae bacterium]